MVASKRSRCEAHLVVIVPVKRDREDPTSTNTLHHEFKRVLEELVLAVSGISPLLPEPPSLLTGIG